MTFSSINPKDDGRDKMLNQRQAIAEDLRILANQAEAVEGIDVDVIHRIRRLALLVNKDEEVSLSTVNSIVIKSEIVEAFHDLADEVDLRGSPPTKREGGVLRDKAYDIMMLISEWEKYTH